MNFLFHLAAMLLLISVYNAPLYAEETPKNNDNNHAEETLSMVSDVWCPYACDSNIENKGLLVDIVTASYKELNLDINYQTYSWVRAVDMVESYEAEILLAAEHMHRNQLILSEDFYINVESVFVVRKSDNITIEKPIDLFKGRLGRIAGYEYDFENIWEPYIQNNENSVAITSSLGEDHLIKLLAHSRIDIAIMNYQVAKLNIKNNPAYKDLEMIRANILNPIFLGFNRSYRGETLKEQFLTGVKMLKKTGMLEALFDKYQIEFPKHMQ